MIVLCMVADANEQGKDESQAYLRHILFFTVRFNFDKYTQSLLTFDTVLTLRLPT